jgi:hypothetical protein
MDYETFKPQIYRCLSNLGGIEVEVSRCGDSVRYSRYESKPSAWRPIHYTTSGLAYFYCKGRREYFRDYLSTNIVSL